MALFLCLQLPDRSNPLPVCATLCAMSAMQVSPG
jgi:hypothetical protein